MLSEEQIRGARAMLNLTQEEFAETCGISPATVYNLEKGHQSRGSSRKIQLALEKKGIIFLGVKGVSLREEMNAVYTGLDSCSKFYETLLSAARAWDDDILIASRTSQHLAQTLGVTDFDELPQLEELNRFADIKCILSEASNASLAIPQIEFRATSQQLTPLTTFTCGDLHAVVIGYQREFTFHVVNSIELANSEKIRFETNWKEAIPFNPNTQASLDKKRA